MQRWQPKEEKVADSPQDLSSSAFQRKCCQSSDNCWNWHQLQQMALCHGSTKISKKYRPIPEGYLTIPEGYKIRVILKRWSCWCGRFEIETSANDSLSISIGRFSDSPDLHFKENLACLAAVEIADAHKQNPLPMSLFPNCISGCNCQIQIRVESLKILPKMTLGPLALSRHSG